MTAFEPVIQLRSRGECCSNARADADFARCEWVSHQLRRHGRTKPVKSTSTKWVS